MVLTKDALLNHLYGGMDEPEMKIIDVFVCKLRSKLALAGCNDMIGTAWGRGYIIREPADWTCRAGERRLACPNRSPGRLKRYDQLKQGGVSPVNRHTTSIKPSVIVRQ